MTERALMLDLGRGCLAVIFIVAAALLLIDLAPSAWRAFRACFRPVQKGTDNG